MANRKANKVIRQGLESGIIRQYSKSYAPKKVNAVLKQLSPENAQKFKDTAKELGLTKQQQAMYLQATLKARKNVIEMRNTAMQGMKLTPPEWAYDEAGNITDEWRAYERQYKENRLPESMPKPLKLQLPKSTIQKKGFETVLASRVTAGASDYLEKSVALYKQNYKQALRDTLEHPQRVIRALNTLTPEQYMKFLQSDSAEINFQYNFDEDEDEQEARIEVILHDIERAKQ